MPACCEPFFDSLGKPQGAIILFKIFKSCSVNGDKDLIIKGKKDMNIAKAMQLLGAAGYIFFISRLAFRHFNINTQGKMA